MGKSREKIGLVPFILAKKLNKAKGYEFKRKT